MSACTHFSSRNDGTTRCSVSLAPTSTRSHRSFKRSRSGWSPRWTRPMPSSSTAAVLSRPRSRHSRSRVGTAPRFARRGRARPVGHATCDATKASEALVHWLLAELDKDQSITHVIEREGDRLPELRDRLRDGVSDRGYRLAAAVISGWSKPVTAGEIDADALAVILAGAIINLRRSTWTFGRAPLGLDDERFIASFVALASSLLPPDLC